jgi:hypothetical protein
LFQSLFLTDSNPVSGTATLRFSRSNAKKSDSGDYYCFAMVGDRDEERMTSAAVPIQVIEGKRNRYCKKDRCFFSRFSEK